MRDTIMLNSGNYKGGNTYKMSFPKSVAFTQGDTLSLYSFSAYNSTYNISGSQYNNNKIVFTWFDNTQYTFIIPDGYYSVSDLNIWLQSQFILNNLYCSSSTGSAFVYFAQFQTNSVRYKNEIDIYYVPSAANAIIYGYSKPPSATWNFPTQDKLVQLTINTQLKSYFGMLSRTTFGNETLIQNYQYLSDTTPIVSPVFSYILTCNLLCSDYSQVPTILAQFPVNVQYGNLINVQSTVDSKISIKPGLYNELQIQLWDQNYTPLVCQDPELTLFLIVETGITQNATKQK